MNGYIKIHRDLLDWEWYDNSVVKDVFLHLLLNATHKEKQWQGITLEPGQVVVSYKSLAEKLGFSVQQTRTAISNIQTTGEITRKSTNKYTVISITNWAKYQLYDGKSTSKITNKIATNQQTNNKQPNNQSTTTEEYNKYKNVKKENKNKYNSLFINARARVRERIGKTSFNAWLSNLEFVCLDNDCVIIATKTSYQAEVIQREFLAVLISELTKEFGNVSLKFVVKYEKE